MKGWRPMECAPRDREILVARYNGCGWEHYVVWWNEKGDGVYPWQSEFNRYVADLFDGWFEIPEHEPEPSV